MTSRPEVYTITFKISTPMTPKYNKDQPRMRPTKGCWAPFVFISSLGRGVSPLLFTCIARSKLVRSPMNNRAADVADEETEFRTLLAEQEARLNKTKVRLLTRANGHKHSTNGAKVEAR